jgi:hypothetical protein
MMALKFLIANTLLLPVQYPRNETGSASLERASFTTRVAYFQHAMYDVNELFFIMTALKFLIANTLLLPVQYPRNEIGSA